MTGSQLSRRQLDHRKSPTINSLLQSVVLSGRPLSTRKHLKTAKASHSKANNQQQFGTAAGSTLTPRNNHFEKLGLLSSGGEKSELPFSMVSANADANASGSTINYSDQNDTMSVSKNPFDLVREELMQKQYQTKVPLPGRHAISRTTPCSLVVSPCSSPRGELRVAQASFTKKKTGSKKGSSTATGLSAQQLNSSQSQSQLRKLLDQVYALQRKNLKSTAAQTARTERRRKAGIPSKSMAASQSMVELGAECIDGGKSRALTKRGQKD